MVGIRASVEESQQRFHKILTETFLLKPQGPIYQSLSQEGIYTFGDLASLHTQDIEELSHTITIEIVSTSALTLTDSVGKRASLR